MMTQKNSATILTSHACESVSGELTPPGDKSISHRSIMLGGLAKGMTKVQGLLEGEDVLATISVLSALGAKIEKNDKVWTIEGVGLEGLQEPDQVLDVGNSGTSARLLIGLLGGRPFTSIFTGDASLRKRPMGRVITPLSQMGISFMSREGGRLPLAVCGASDLKSIRYDLPVASAQVKSAILLAGLSAKDGATVIERKPTRDHSERMLASFGATVEINKMADGAEEIHIAGFPELKGQEVLVPADISSAAFPMVAASMKEGASLLIRNVGLNERRAGIVTSLIEMGAKITKENERNLCGEPVADLRVEGSVLKGATIPAARAPSMIDEYPVLAMAAACAEGTSRFEGLAELRVKESDRLTLVAEGLKACGVSVEIEGDDLIIHGNGKPPLGGAMIKTELDHRIAMSFLVLGTQAQEPIAIDDARVMETSFPGFVPMMNNLGARIS